MADNKTVSIYVNTVAHNVPHQKISYETLIGLAFPGATGTNYIVKYYRGNSDNLTGTLPPGGEDTDDPDGLASRLIFREHPGMVRGAWVRGRLLPADAPGLPA